MTKRTKNSEKIRSYRGYTWERKYGQWYSNDFKGSLSTWREVTDYIDGRIARGNLTEN
jgi:hypothetical protein